MDGRMISNLASRIKECENRLKRTGHQVTIYPDRSFCAKQLVKDYEIWFAPSKESFPTGDDELWATFSVYVYLWENAEVEYWEKGELTNRTCPTVYFGQARNVRERYIEHIQKWESSNKKANCQKYASLENVDGILWFRRSKTINSQIDALAIERKLYFVFPKKSNY